MHLKSKKSKIKIIQLAKKSAYGSEQYSICTPKIRFLLKEIQPPHVCNWRHFLCHWSTPPTSISAADHTAVYGWETARHNTLLLFSQKDQQPGHYPSQSPPAQIFKAFGKQNTLHTSLSRLFILGVVWGGGMWFPLSSWAAGRGRHALPRLLEPQQPRKPVTGFACQKQKEKIHFHFQEKYFFTSWVNAPVLPSLCALT